MITLIDLKRIEPKEAADLTWQLLLERPATANISHSEMPTREAHNEYVWSAPHQGWYAVLNAQGDFVGTTLLTHHNEIGIAILKQHQRKGYARAAIEAIMAKHAFDQDANRPRAFLANISPKNAGSIALFCGLGFEHVQQTYRAYAK